MIDQGDISDPSWLKLYYKCIYVTACITMPTTRIPIDMQLFRVCSMFQTGGSVLNVKACGPHVLQPYCVSVIVTLLRCNYLMRIPSEIDQE